MTDSYEGIFEHLTPDDFARDTSAVEQDENRVNGLEAFNAFVDEQIRMLRTAYIAASGDLDPIAIIASPTVQRMFTPDDDESNQAWVDRVAHEARLIRANWTFVGKKAPVAVVPPSEDGQVRDSMDKTLAQQAIAAGTVKIGMMFYAEYREDGERFHRLGQMAEVAPHRLGPVTENTVQEMPLFAEILAD